LNNFFVLAFVIVCRQQKKNSWLTANYVDNFILYPRKEIRLLSAHLRKKRDFRLLASHQERKFQLSTLQNGLLKSFPSPFLSEWKIVAPKSMQ